MFWSVFIITFIIFSPLIPFWNPSQISNDLHQFCLESLNFESPWKPLYQSLICGKKLPESSLKKVFIEGGLIHLTVVSGAHLLFLERIWKTLPLPLFIKNHGLFLILIFYTLITQMHAPVLRALFSFCISYSSKKLKLFWNSNFIIFVSGILCLIYKPTWIHSISLQLSLLACFLLNFSIKPLNKCFFVYLFLLPIINRWQNLHPVTVLVNWLLAPLIGSLLFPLSFLSSFFPFLYPLTDFLWSLTLQILKLIEFLPAHSSLIKIVIPKNWIWYYIVFIRFLIFIIHKWNRQKIFHKRI